MKCLLANPNVAPHIKETLTSYYEHGYLDRFYTSYFFDATSGLNQSIIKYFPAVANELKRRSIPDIPPSIIKCRPLPELLRVLSSRKLSDLITDKIWEWGELSFDEWVARNLRKDLDWVHVSEHAGLATLKKAKKLGVLSIYEQPSQHHLFFTEVVKRQIQRYPDFNNKEIDLLIDQTAQRRNRRRDEELLTSDIVLCNSSFTRNTLLQAGVSSQKILTVPLGFPPIKERELKAVNEKTIFMYAGNLSLRKGIHLLLQAWKELLPKTAELWLVGRQALPDVFFGGLPDSIKLLPNIPHTDLMALYRQADVFILPTLADGFGMVITEAMSAGLPVITTTNSGGADLIENEKDGLVISPECKEAISKAICWCLAHKAQLFEMGHSAQNKALKYPWAAFRRKLVETIVEKRSEWESKKRSVSLHPGI